MLKIAQKAPSFSLPNQNGEMISSSQFKGKYLVLYFYPKDKTPGCTTEAKEFSSLLNVFEKLHASVLGVSKDSVKTHLSFQESCDLSITLLSDPDFETHKAYGAFGEKNMYGKKVTGCLRTTYLISPKGEVIHIWEKVKVANHAAAVLETLKNLQSES